MIANYSQAHPVLVYRMNNPVDYPEDGTRNNCGIF